MIDLIWLTIVLPIAGVLFNGVFGRRLGRGVVSIVGPLVVLGAFVPSLVGIVFTHLTQDRAGRRDFWVRVVDLRRLIDPTASERPAAD